MFPASEHEALRYCSRRNNVEAQSMISPFVVSPNGTDYDNGLWLQIKRGEIDNQMSGDRIALLRL